MGNAANREACRDLAIWSRILHNQPVHAAPASSSPKTTWTILEVVRWTTGRFERHGIASPRLDAELLAARAFGRSRVELYVHFDQPLSDGELGAYRGLVERRLAGEPVAYILGRKEFWSLDLEVGPAVLVPRPDTETIVEQALEFLRGLGDGVRRVVDVGTGSGAIALALKHERPADEVVAVDVSPDALAQARANAERLALPVTFTLGDLVAPLHGLARFDLVVSNPPYIPTADLPGLPAEVRHEPRLALDGGDDGLALVRRLASEAVAVLVPGGGLALEIGAGQAPAAMAILRQTGYTAVGSRADLAGIERVVFGQRGE